MKKNPTLSESVSTELVPDEGLQRSLSQKVEKISNTPDRTKPRQKSYVMDLRIHTPESLGYFGIDEIDTAPALVRLAKVKGLDMIAVTDFFSAAFIDRIMAAAKGSPLIVIPGVDLRCRVNGCDDVILSCLFPETYDKSQLESFLAALKVPESAMGDKNHILDMPFKEALSVLDSFGGIGLPSRMDKTPYRFAVIPALVEEFGFRCFDLAYSDSAKFFKGKWPKTKFHLFSFSDASALAQVGSRYARVKMATPGFEGVKLLATRETQKSAGCDKSQKESLSISRQ
jgi:hypothetical protein